MKILMLAEGMDIGGAETHVVTLVRALRQRGDEVTLLCMGGRYRDALRNEGIACIDAPTGKRDPLSLWECTRILRACLQDGYDCIHAHTRGMATLVRRTTSMPLVVTVHLDFPVGPVRRRLCRFGDHVLCVSEDLSHYVMREYAVEPQDISLTCNGIDAAQFPQEEADEHTIVHVSRLDRDRSRAAMLLCEIAPKLLSQFPRAKILLCGGGNQEKCIQLLANKANKQLGHIGVVYLGSTADVYSVLKKGAVFVGVSRCALEAMSVGAAVVLAGNDGYGGILSQKNFAHHALSNFCARGEEGACADKLYRDLAYLLAHPGVIRQHIKEGRQFVKEHYAPSRMAADAHAAYESAIRKRRQRITLLGYYGYGNLGDELTCQLLNRALSPQHPTTLVRGFFAHGAEKNRFFHALPAIRESGTLVFGGGNLFQNTTSNRSLFYYTSLLRYAHARGCRTVLLGGGIGDFKDIRGRLGMQKAASHFDRVACRTRADLSFIQALGIPNGEYLPDPCFLYQPTPLRSPLHRTSCDAARQKSILLLLRGKEHISRDLFLQNARAEGYRLIFTPLFPKEDAAVCRRLAKRYAGQYRPAPSADALSTLLRETDFAICERLHGAILALLNFTPAYLLQNSTKTRRWIADCEEICRAHSVASPIFPFQYYTQICADLCTRASLYKERGEDATSSVSANKKETEGQAFGFSELITYFRSFYETESLL